VPKFQLTTKWRLPGILASSSLSACQQVFVGGAIFPMGHRDAERPRQHTILVHNNERFTPGLSCHRVQSDRPLPYRRVGFRIENQLDRLLRRRRCVWKPFSSPDREACEHSNRMSLARLYHDTCRFGHMVINFRHRRSPVRCDDRRILRRTTKGRNARSARLFVGGRLSSNKKISQLSC